MSEDGTGVRNILGSISAGNRFYFHFSLGASHKSRKLNQCRYLLRNQIDSRENFLRENYYFFPTLHLKTNVLQNSCSLTIIVVAVV